jgi:sterol desaturase/sphingolipid hydroxylase (fatty acid hydroxylase superfamily)
MERVVHQLGSAALTGVCFLLFTIVVWRRLGVAGWLRSRRPTEWSMDAVGLWIQGVTIPLLQAWLVVQGLRWLCPNLEGMWSVPGWVAFLGVFVGVDYAYYWNHRLLHRRSLWPIHRVHHGSRVLDVWATSRNPVWASFLIVYLWLNGAWLFVTGCEAAVLWAAALSSAMDLWRHSGCYLSPRIDAWVGRVLITPTDHAWHHAGAGINHNYGANFSVWDRMHDTYRKFERPPDTVGVPVPGTVFRQLVWPYQ